MNKEYILSRVKPYLNSRGMLGEEDFNKLFARLPIHQQYKIIDILIESNIEIDYVNVSIDSEKGQIRNEPRGMYAGKLDKLTNEQLCVIYQQGNDQALEALISKNIRLVRSRVNKYKNAYKHKLDEEDLMQYGVMGLMKAADKFESTKEAKFITYATWWVDQGIYRSIQDYGFTIRIPAHSFDDVNKLMRVFREHPNYSKYQIYEIVRENGMSRDKFEEILRIAENIISLSSLNSIVGEDESSELGEFVVDETIETVEEIVESKALKEAIEDVLDTITPRENKILRLRFGFDDGREKTLEEVGKEFGVTRERIRQIEAKALRKLRHPARSKILKDFI